MKIRVLDNNVIRVKSTITAKEYELLSTFKPEALALYDEETNEKVFCVMRGNPSDAPFGKFGVTFNGTSLCEDPVLTATVTLPDNFTGDIKLWIADHLGSALNKLEKVEAQIAAGVGAVNSAREDIMSKIEFAD